MCLEGGLDGGATRGHLGKTGAQRSPGGGERPGLVLCCKVILYRFSHFTQSPPLAPPKKLLGFHSTSFTVLVDGTNLKFETKLVMHTFISNNDFENGTLS